MATQTDLKREIREIQLNMYKMVGKIQHQIEQKEMLKRASKPLLDELIDKTPEGKTGNLKNSMGYIPLNKSKYAVFVGPIYRLGGYHAHLVEYGYIHKSGIRVEGKHFMRKALRAKSKEVLTRLTKELKDFMDKLKV